MERIAERVHLLVSETGGFYQFRGQIAVKNAFDDFWKDFSELLELLVKEYNSRRCRDRRGYPYPLARDFCYHFDRLNKQVIKAGDLWVLTNRFLRKYAVIAAGDSGWRTYSFGGIQCTPTEKEFF